MANIYKRHHLCYNTNIDRKTLMTQNYVSSEGEKIIEYYLDEQNIKYKREVEIPDLKNDSKIYRRADFLLTDFKVYIEFLGKWNDPDSRKSYQEKKHTYEHNNIPCVYIYPDNLGILDTIFRMRTEEQLEKNPNLKPQLIKFRFWKFKKVLWICVDFSIVLNLLGIIIDNTLNHRLHFGFFSFIVPIITMIVFAIYGAKLIFLKKK